MRRIIVGITGASGAILGIRLLEGLGQVPEIETHLILTDCGAKTVALETDYSPEEVKALAAVAHPPEDIAASIASGSYPVEAMAVVPCSMKSLSSIVHSFGDNLLTRATDVTLKEGRPLILSPRETPLHKGHLDILRRCADLGAVILPPMVAFYHRPKTIGDIIDHTVSRVLDLFGIDNDLVQRWGGG